MELRKLDIPSTFEQILRLYKEYKHKIFSGWCNMHYHELKIASNSMQQQINAMIKSRDPDKEIKAAIGIRILGKLHPIHLEELLAKMTALMPCENDAAAKFISYMVAKFCRRHYLKELKFIIEQLSKCKIWLSEKEFNYKIRNALYLLDWLGSMASSAVIASSKQFMDTLMLGYFHENLEVRLKSFDIGSTFLEHSKKGASILEHFNNALMVVQSSSVVELHGSLLVLISYAKSHPDLALPHAKSLMNTCRFSTQHDEQFISDAALALLIMMAPLDPIVYRTTHAQAVLNSIWYREPFSNIAIQCMIPIMHHFPEYFVGKGEKIIEIMEKLLADDGATVMFKIIETFAEYVPNEMIENLTGIAEIIVKSPLSQEFIDTIPHLLQTIPNLWSLCEQELGRRFVDILTEKRAEVRMVLLMIGKFMSFSNEMTEELFELVHPMLNDPDPSIREAAPIALFGLKDARDESYAVLLHEILSLAVSETCLEVRIAILESLKPPYSPCLLMPSSLDLFSVLVNDESFRIKKLTLSILGALSAMNPSMILPIFRRVLLDALFICDSSPLLRLQEETTRCLTVIIEAAEPILPVYIPAFIPIALSYLRSRFVHAEPTREMEQEAPFLYQHLPISLSFHENTESGSRQVVQRGTQQTYFEQKYSVLVAVNFIDTITLSCRKQRDLLTTQYVEITNLFLKILEINTHKLIAIAVLNALDYIIEFLGPSAVTEFPTLLQNLFDLGSKFTSSKVHALIFKIYGHFGPIAPTCTLTADQVELYDEEIKLDVSAVGSQISISDWNLSISAAALISILEDQNLSVLHYDALSVLSNWPLDTSPVVRPFFNRFVLYLLSTVRSAPSDEKDRYFPLLHKILHDHKDWLKPFAGNFAHLTETLMDSSFISHALTLTPEISASLGESFAPYLPQIVSTFLDALFNTEMTHPQLASQILMTLTRLSTFATDYVFIILRQMAEVVFNPMLNIQVVISALKAMNIIVQQYDCSSYSSLLVRSCFQAFHSNDDAVRTASVELLCALRSSLGPSFHIYAERAKLQLESNGLYTDKVREVLEFVPGEKESEAEIVEDRDETSEYQMIDDLEVDEEELITSSKNSISFSSGQWKDWCRNFVLSVIRVAPSKILRDCYPLAKASYQFAMRLFHSAFLSCWAKMSERTKDTICERFTEALTDSDIPMSVLTTIVGLAEFMEKTDEHLRISYASLTVAALRAEKLPFALYCEQRDENVTTRKTEKLISIYSQLGLDDDVQGLINSLRHTPDIKMTAKLAEQLGDWTNAIELYREDGSQASLMSLLRSLTIVNDWDAIADMYRVFDDLPATVKTQVAHFFANAFSNLQNWELFDAAIRYADQNLVDTVIIHCLAQHARGLDYRDMIDVGFRLLGSNAGPLFPHGYSSLVPFFVQAEQLVEIEEASRKVVDHWATRIRSNRLTFQQMEPLIRMRIQLLQPKNAQAEISKLLKLTRDSGEWSLHNRFMKLYYPDFDPATSNPSVVFEHSISLWKRREKADAIAEMEALVNNRLAPNADPLLERGLVTLARWKARADYQQQSAKPLLEAADLCQRVDSTNQKARLFYAWTQLRLYNLKQGDREFHAIEAIKGFIRCASGISEMMQLCSIVFRAGRFTRVFEAIKGELAKLDLELWIRLIPQLFAQLSNPSEHLANFAKDTLRRALIEHHHIVIFSLLFCVGFSRESAKIGRDMLEEYRLMNPSVVENAHRIYIGLLSACMTKTEQWHDALNIMYEHFKQNQYAEMKDVFEKNFARIKMENCDADLLFNRVYAYRIVKLEPTFRFFFVSKNRKHLETVWKDVREIKDAMKAEIESMTSIPLKFVAPMLSDLANVDIAVPGTYTPGKPINRISHFANSMDVFPSKQRPKRFAVIGSDGHEFWYLLKGHEDLRLDQRVVQLFLLINHFIPAEMPKIVTNFIMPLSPTVGVIQWIPGSDTLFKLIREYRAARGIPTDIELRSMMAKSCAKVDTLRPIQRYEILKEVAAETTDTVLADIMWLKAPNSETWVKRMSNFSRTSGLMSVVGYLLGLGDRHTSNLMIHKFTGSVIHVDFGDCFEIAKERVMFPELIPFRLTRFMVRAFGPSGIDGAFRKSCLDMIHLIRDKREGIMSVLEIFAHAPIVRTLSGEVAEMSPQRGDEESVKKVISRINDKIFGRDFGSDRTLSREDQVAELISSATDMYNMAHLFHGWKPLW